MSNTKNKNVQAFPLAMPCSPDERGMTMRDYFAAKAMTMLMQEWPINIFDNDAQDEVARNCYTMADAMLKAREK